MSEPKQLYLENYTMYKHQTCTSLRVLLMTCGFQWSNIARTATCLLTTHGRVLMHKCLQKHVQGRHRQCCLKWKLIHLIIWTGNFLPSSVNSKRCASVIFGVPVCKPPLQSGGIALFLGLLISAQEHLNLLGVQSLHTYSRWDWQLDAWDCQTSVVRGIHGMEWIDMLVVVLGVTSTADTFSTSLR